jgi:hypothetical protein
MDKVKTIALWHALTHNMVCTWRLMPAKPPSRGAVASCRNVRTQWRHLRPINRHPARKRSAQAHSNSPLAPIKRSTKVDSFSGSQGYRKPRVNSEHWKTVRQSFHLIG